MSLGIFNIMMLMAWAHPVTFKGGTMVKSMVREDMSENSVTFTFHRQMAIGVELDRLQLGPRDTHWGLLELNGLLRRWNGDHSQANLYLLTGAGGYLFENQSEWAGKWGVQADFETRQFYSLAAISSWHSESVHTQMFLARVGFAPFVAGYNDLNLWAILQLDVNRDMRNEVQITPLLRFFYRNTLWEMGASVRGNFYWQFMVHF